MARLSTLSRSIAGKVAVVTGAASGMGAATAYLLADEGAAVAVLDRDGDGAGAVAARIVGAGGRAVAVPVDVADAAALDAAIDVELGPSGVTVNCVCPGPIHTGMTALIADDAKVRFARRRVPLRRYGDPEEVAHITLGLVLPASSYLTGAVIAVDGGLTVQNT